MIWLITYWKQILIGSLFLAWSIGVWRAHSWYDAYHIQNSEIKAIDNLGKGESKIFKFNGDLDKAKENVKDNCIDKPIPLSFISLLK